MDGICITNTTPALNAIVTYRTPKRGFTLTQAQWDMIVGNIEKNSHCILVEDFNAHKQFWNCKKTGNNDIRFF